MPLWKHNNRWRYEFEHLGKRYGKAGFPTKAEARAAMEKHRAEIKKWSSNSPKSTDFLEAATEYLEYSQRRFAQKTYKYKAFVYRCFLDFAGNLPLERISVQVIESYLATRHSNTNFNRHRKDLSALFNWAWKRRLMPYNPCHYIEKLGEDKSKRLIPTEEELNKILLAAGEDRPFLIVLYHTLGRVGEIMRLRWDDVNFEKRIITLWTRKRKGGSWEPDNLPMNDTLYDTLKNLWQKRAHPEWVFPNPRTGDRYHSRPKLMRGICRRAGVRYFGFHTIRHFVASLLTDREKVGTPTISKLLRHKSLRTTELYLQKVEDNLLETVRKLDLEKNPAQNPAQSVSEG